MQKLNDHYNKNKYYKNEDLNHLIKNLRPEGPEILAGKEISFIKGRSTSPLTGEDCANHPVHENKIGIIGAGPVGSLLAVYLAQRGYSVEMYERRPDMRREKISAGRSINLAVSTRGLHALREIGCEEEILQQSIPMRGRMIHSVQGELTFQPYGMNEKECIHSMSRGGLNQTLMTLAEKTGKVQIHFHQKAQGFDFEAGKLKIKNDETGVDSTIQLPTWIAADGSSSVIRDAMMQLPGYQCTEDHLDYGYKELHIPPGPGGSFLIEKNALHIWPRGTYMLIALPNFDGSFTCTLFLPYKGSPSFETLNSADAVSQFFNDQFRDAVPLIPDLIETFFSHPTGSMVTVKCAPWHVSDRLLLIGDSAHAIVPFFGQGMNCGFEDCTVLNQLIGQRSSGDRKINWREVFTQFFETRKVNADCIADMALENFIEMRDKVAHSEFLMQKAVEKILQKNFPGDFISRYSLVTFSRIPYQVAFEAGRVEDEVLTELCHGLKSAEEVDLVKAKDLIEAKVKPVLR